MAGVAPGTIYLFAESKEALFWLALARTMGRPLEDVSCETPTAGELRQRFAPHGASPSLSAWLDSNRGDMPSLDRIVGEFWETVDRAAPAIKLVEKCASDWPELAAAFYVELRPTVLRNLTEYLVRGAAAGVCRAVPDPALAARLIMETIAWFAMHRRGDPDGRFYDDEAARRVTLDALIHAYGRAPTKEKK